MSPQRKVEEERNASVGILFEKGPEVRRFVVRPANMHSERFRTVMTRVSGIEADEVWDIFGGDTKLFEHKARTYYNEIE